MNEDFVPFELAVKLKEKGFPFKYKTEGKLGLTKIRKVEILPCISEVLKWLREEKKIYIVIAVNPTLSTKDKIAYYYQVYSNCNGVTSDYYESEECYAQWEDCAIDSIKSVLDNLIL